MSLRSSISLPHPSFSITQKLSAHLLVFCLHPSIKQCFSPGGEPWNQERARQDREATRVKLLEPWLVPIVALFEGRIIGKPESYMPTTEYSTGQSVEHEIIMLGGGALFLVIEMKLELPQDANLARLFLEPLSAAKVNEKTNFGALSVYGLLTDLSSFRFYSYDPEAKIFNPDEDSLINTRRDDFCYGMIQVANKVFSVIMCAYVEGLRASVDASKKKSDPARDIPSILPSNPTPKVKSKFCPSLSDWENAFAEADLAYSKQ